MRMLKTPEAVKTLLDEWANTNRPTPRLESYLPILWELATMTEQMRSHGLLDEYEVNIIGLWCVSADREQLISEMQEVCTGPYYELHE